VEEEEDEEEVEEGNVGRMGANTLHVWSVETESK